MAQAISQRVSAAVMEALTPVTQEIHVALTDVDEDALEANQIGVHVQRLPAHGLQHPWALWREAPADAEDRARTETTPPPGIPDRALSLRISGAVNQVFSERSARMPGTATSSRSRSDQ